MPIKASEVPKIAIQIRVDADLYSAIKEAAKQDDRSIPNTVLAILRKALTTKANPVYSSDDRAQAKTRSNQYISVKKALAEAKQRVLEQRAAINKHFNVEVIEVQDDSNMYYMRDKFDQEGVPISTAEGAEAALSRRYFGILDPRALHDEFVQATMRSMGDYSREAYERITGDDVHD